MKDTGLVKDRGRQRTDPACLLASVRELTRLELVLEAVLAAREETARTHPELLDGLVTEDRAMRYGRQVRLVSRPIHPAARLKQADADAAELLDRARRSGPAGRGAMEVLRQIMVQHFLVDARGQVRPRTETKDGLPPARVRIELPYDLQARWMRRCRYRGTAKAHVQHVLTAIAVDIERLTTQEPTDTTYQPRPRGWRQGQRPSKNQDPRQSHSLRPRSQGGHHRGDGTIAPILMKRMSESVP